MVSRCTLISAHSVCCSPRCSWRLTLLARGYPSLFFKLAQTDSILSGTVIMEMVLVLKILLLLSARTASSSQHPCCKAADDKNLQLYFSLGSGWQLRILPPSKTGLNPCSSDTLQNMSLITQTLNWHFLPCIYCSG